MGLLSNLRKVVETTVKNGWTATPVRYPNVPFKQPANGLFVSLAIQLGVSNITSLGTSKREEQTGIVVLTINTPPDGGSKQAIELADAAQALFRCKQFTEGERFRQIIIGPRVQAGDFILDIIPGRQHQDGDVVFFLA